MRPYDSSTLLKRENIITSYSQLLCDKRHTSDIALTPTSHGVELNLSNELLANADVLFSIICKNVTIMFYSFTVH